MQGRIHYYEGYDITDVVLPTRLMGLMGVKALFLTNASAGSTPTTARVNSCSSPTTSPTSSPPPLIGPNIDELGTRFPDMTDLYSARLREVVRGAAKELAIPLREGVYVQLTGPNFETPAEVRMCRILGGDAVGMSTAVEAVAAPPHGDRNLRHLARHQPRRGLSLSPSPTSRCRRPPTARPRSLNSSSPRRSGGSPR